MNTCIWRLQLVGENWTANRSALPMQALAADLFGAKGKTLSVLWGLIMECGFQAPHCSACVRAGGTPRGRNLAVQIWPKSEIPIRMESLGFMIV
jgi:hypothetical protein